MKATKSKYYTYLSHVILWLIHSNTIYVSSRVDFTILPRLAMIVHSAHWRGIFGSYSVTDVVLSPHKKNSNGMSYGRRKIQALSANLLTWCVMKLKSQGHTLTSWGRLVSICKGCFKFFKGCYFNMTPKRLICSIC